MATIETINKALEVLKNHDWWWMMADYTHPAIDNARGSMRYFVNFGKQPMRMYIRICGVRMKKPTSNMK